MYRVDKSVAGAAALHRTPNFWERGVGQILNLALGSRADHQDELGPPHVQAVYLVVTSLQRLRGVDPWTNGLKHSASGRRVRGMGEDYLNLMPRLNHLSEKAHQSSLNTHCSGSAQSMICLANLFFFKRQGSIFINILWFFILLVVLFIVT
jgi:hypothetical protein